MQAIILAAGMGKRLGKRCSSDQPHLKPARTA